MQAIALRPQRWQITTQLVGLALCVGGMLVFPVLCLPLCLLIPLFSCPLIGLKQQWAVFLALPAPTLISLLNGFDALYSASLFLLCGLPAALAEHLRSTRKAGAALAFLYYICAYAAALLAVAACAARLFGGGLADGLSDLLTASVRSSPNAGATLYQLAASGVIGVPKAYQNAGALSFMLDPVLARQLLLSLRLSLNLAFHQILPSLFVQSCILGGVFTALRVQRLNHSYLLVDGQPPAAESADRVQIAVSPGFSMLQLPPSLRWPTALMALCALLFSLSPSALVQQLSLLFYTAFLCVYELIGAAVMVCLLSARHPDRKGLFGLLAAVVYLVFPVALFLIGVLDPILHFRSKTLFQQEEE